MLEAWGPSDGVLARLSAIASVQGSGEMSKEPHVDIHRRFPY